MLLLEQYVGSAHLLMVEPAVTLTRCQKVSQRRTGAATGRKRLNRHQTYRQQGNKISEENFNREEDG